ncbi:unnamed protein product [Cylindrotheca closterium]|uniref:Uncharacterized protein n=1 Tax=Cylindrotheca closterium TaxID=2856 RepID=A0AAD2CT34_9STRA|nr:unnamed protein product [Cylindrotheca closterium]
MRIIEYAYGAPDMRESTKHTATPEESRSASSSTVEEDRGDITLPLHHHHEAKPTQRLGAHTFDPSVPVSWTTTTTTPIKSVASRVETYQTTPSTTASLDDDDYLDDSSYVLPPTSRYTTDQLNDNDHEVRLAINFLNLQPHLLPPDTQLQKSKAEVILQTFTPKLVLEVMGGAGAVWGFTEAIGLRTSATVWFWRPVTFIAGGLFFIRWYQQLQEFSRLYDLRRARRRSAVEGETAHLLWQDNV